MFASLIQTFEVKARQDLKPLLDSIKETQLGITHLSPGGEAYSSLYALGPEKSNEIRRYEEELRTGQITCQEHDRRVGRIGEQLNVEIEQQKREWARAVQELKPLLAALASSECLLERALRQSEQNAEVRYRLLDVVYTQILINLRPFESKYQEIGRLSAQFKNTLTQMRLQYGQLTRVPMLPYIPQAGISAGCIVLGGTLLYGVIPAMDGIMFRLFGLSLLLAGVYSIAHQLHLGVRYHSDNLGSLFQTTNNAIQTLNQVVIHEMNNVVESGKLEVRIINNRAMLFAGYAQNSLYKLGNTVDQNMKALVNKIKVDVDVKARAFAAGVCNIL